MKSSKEYKIDGLTLADYEEYREYLATSKRYAKAYQVWSDDLDNELLNLSVNLSVAELAKHFGRTRGAIKSRLKRLAKGEKTKDSPQASKDRRQHSRDSEILDAILGGYNPHTEEILNTGSCWMHPSIKKDIRSWRLKLQTDS